jgi:hypothetical protein
MPCSLLTPPWLPYGGTEGLVYIGWHFEPVPGGFEEMVLRELDRMGSLTVRRDFAGASGAAVLKVDRLGASFGTHDTDSYHSTHPNGCLSVQPAARR